MTKGWTEESFTKCIQKTIIYRDNQVKKEHYLAHGKHPIIDQGQNKIAGWTNSNGLIITNDLPYIVFGDHTRIFKYIDFPFALGADGTRLIKPKKNINPRFFYYVLNSLTIQSRGYSRHYKLLKEQTIPFPPLPEQKKIAAVMLKIQQSITAQEKIIESLLDLKKSTMQHLFAKGLHGEKTKMTENGSIPKSWKIKPLGKCCTVQTGIAKGRKIDPAEAIELPYLRVANVQNGYLDLTKMKTILLRKSELARFSLQNGDVVLTEGGDFDKLGRGFVWEGQIASCVHQNHVFAVRSNAKEILPHFLAYLAQSPYGRAYFLRVAHKTTNLACINTTKLKQMPVPLPSLQEQEDIINVLQNIDKKLKHNNSRKHTLQSLFKTTLNKLMTGKIRVSDLDIDVKEVEDV